MALDVLDLSFVLVGASLDQDVDRVPALEVDRAAALLGPDA